MIRNKKFKKIGLIFGLKREMKLILHHKKDNFCVYGYGKYSKGAVNKLLNQQFFQQTADSRQQTADRLAGSRPTANSYPAMHNR